MTSASAPGKLFLIGEYAVLEGAPAPLVTVPQRAKVSLEEGEPKVKTITATEDAHPFQEVPILNALIDTLEKHALAVPDFDRLIVTLDTGEFFLRETKLGLGSSAALTVALIKAVTGLTSPADVIPLATHCHRTFQGGIGSGGDVALAAMDKDIVFEPGKPPSPLLLPEDFHQLCIFSGESASTTELIHALERWKREHESLYVQHMDQLFITVKRSLEAIAAGSGSGFIDCLRQYGEQLKALSDVSGIGAYNSTHLGLRKRVELAHCVYKPSGAGGGDFGIAVSTERENLAGLQQELELEGTYTFFLDKPTNP